MGFTEVFGKYCLLSAFQSKCICRAASLNRHPAYPCTCSEACSRTSRVPQQLTICIEEARIASNAAIETSADGRGTDVRTSAASAAVRSLLFVNPIKTLVPEYCAAAAHLEHH